MWGKGLPGMGFGGCEASEVVGWIGSGDKNHPSEGPSVSAFTPLTINKDMHFLRTDRHTPRCTHSYMVVLEQC